MFRLAAEIPFEVSGRSPPFFADDLLEGARLRGLVRAEKKISVGSIPVRDLFERVETAPCGAAVHTLPRVASASYCSLMGSFADREDAL